MDIYILNPACCIKQTKNKAYLQSNRSRSRRFGGRRWEFCAGRSVVKKRASGPIPTSPRDPQGLNWHHPLSGSAWGSVRPLNGLNRNGTALCCNTSPWQRQKIRFTIQGIYVLCFTLWFECYSGSFLIFFPVKIASVTKSYFTLHYR